MADLKNVYTCRQIRITREFAVDNIGTCLTTENVEEIDAHRKEVFTRDNGAGSRNHMLDINKFDEDGKWQGQEGMCLPDGIIDLKEGTIKHFMNTEAWKRGKES